VPVMQALSPLLKLAGGRPLVAEALAYGTLIPAAVITGGIFYILVERPCMNPSWPGKLLVLLRLRSDRRTPETSSASQA
jgi:peptidoglycan/LPS O-acetylase OafA/YrhL